MAILCGSTRIGKDVDKFYNSAEGKQESLGEKGKQTLHRSGRNLSQSDAWRQDELPSEVLGRAGQQSVGDI